MSADHPSTFGELLRRHRQAAGLTREQLAERPDFRVRDENAPAVAEVCVQLDGLSLAIKLAAARVRLFDPEALLSRLGHRLRLLSGGPRDTPARQRTLRTAMDWSHDLLREDERILFHRLLVFAGGSVAAEWACGGNTARVAGDKSGHVA